MSKSLFQDRYLSVLANFGSICHFIVVDDDLNMLSLAYSNSERFYGHVHTPRTSLTTTTKMKTVFSFHFGKTPNENQGRFLKSIME